MRLVEDDLARHALPRIDPTPEAFFNDPGPRAVVRGDEGVSSGASGASARRSERSAADRP